MRTLYARQRRDPNATLDFLPISGGGDRGAFGTGFLLGWATVASGADALPKFDGVSGVSTGAVIAPFAFLGTDADYEKIDRLFRNPRPDWVEQRGVFSSCPRTRASPSSGSRARPACAGRPAVRRGTAEAGSTDGHRVLPIQATDIDNGTARAFDAVAAAREAVVTSNTELLEKYFAFLSRHSRSVTKPREIQGRLYADGGTASNFFYGRPMDGSDTFGASIQTRRFENALPGGCQ